MIRQEKFQSWTIGLPHSTAPCPILIIQTTRLGNDKYKFLSHCFNLIMVLNPRVSNPTAYQNQKADAQLVRPSRLARNAMSVRRLSRWPVIHMYRVNSDKQHWAQWTQSSSESAWSPRPRPHGKSRVRCQCHCDTLAACNRSVTSYSLADILLGRVRLLAEAARRRQPRSRTATLAPLDGLVL